MAAAPASRVRVASVNCLTAAPAPPPPPPQSGRRGGGGGGGVGVMPPTVNSEAVFLEWILRIMEMITFFF